jgi:hypothetical protein
LGTCTDAVTENKGTDSTPTGDNTVTEKKKQARLRKEVKFRGEFSRWKREL